MGKPRVAIFDLTDCEGCEVVILNSENVDKIVEGVEFVHFRIGQARNEFSEFDIAFIEGSAVTHEEVEFVKNVRELSKVVVALGTCACFGGIAALTNFADAEESKRYVYGEKASAFPTVKVQPLGAHIKIDLMLRGCPISKEDFDNLVSDVFAGRIPREHARPVCIDCKNRENPCLLLEKVPCAGPMTYGGCGAPCPSSNMPCDGCRGPLEAPELNAELDLLKKIADEDDITRLFRKYAVVAPYFVTLNGEVKK
jgi:sulfhydrogenase subunit delta